MTSVFYMYPTAYDKLCTCMKLLSCFHFSFAREFSTRFSSLRREVQGARTVRHDALLGFTDKLPDCTAVPLMGRPDGLTDR